MYHFLQFNPNKKEAWKLYAESQLHDLPQPPAFITVLAVDKDPESVAEQGEDPIDHVKYFGPMYFDFDGADIDEVLDDVRGVLEHLTKQMEIPKAFIHCWLSGQKGVHITVPAQVFGIKTPTKLLPWIWQGIAETFQADTLDRSVYSCGRGRMWRCEGVARPNTGTFKIGVTYDELMEMDADQYTTLVADPRPPLSQQVPAKSLVFPKAESAMKVAKQNASKKLRAMKSATTIPADKLRALEETPGCIEILINEGDCVESNWNQAAMQLASFIAARYNRDESAEYESELVTPFVVNVESSSRPTEKERRKHVHDQLNRAFGGRMKFAPGALIATIGKPCGNCIICRGDVADKPVEESVAVEGLPIVVRANNYFQETDNGARQLSSGYIDPQSIVYILEKEEDYLRLGQEEAMLCTVVTPTGSHTNIRVPNDVWQSTKGMQSLMNGYGGSFRGSDKDLQVLKEYMTALVLKKGVNKVIRTEQCGLMFYREQSGAVSPHYVEYRGSYARYGVESPFKYFGDPSISTNLIAGDYPDEGDTEVEEAIYHLCRINEPHWVGAMIGWMVACHFREHLHQEFTQFPLLNISGNAGSGKSSTAFLLCNLNGIDYTTADFMNVEVATIYPLIKFISSSTTVPRLIEEVNPSIMSNQVAQKVLGIFKAAWNRSPVPRGHIASGKGVAVSQDRVSSPVVYTSEQTSIVPSLRNRTVEVKLSSKALVNSDMKDHFRAAYERRPALQRLAKSLVTTALSTSPRDVAAGVRALAAEVPETIGERPRYSFQVVLYGLEMLAKTLDDSGLKGADDVAMISKALKEFLQDHSVDMEREKSISEVDRVLASMDEMAGEDSDRSDCLRPGDHYWRAGKFLSIVLQSCMPRYCRYARNIGDTPVIRDARQMASLLQGEVYFDRKEVHPHRPGVDVFVIDLSKMTKKSFALTNFQDGTEPAEV